VLVIFVVLSIAAVIKFYPEAKAATERRLAM
jgi:hypothetical protein